MQRRSHGCASLPKDRLILDPSEQPAITSFCFRYNQGRIHESATAIGTSRMDRRCGAVTNRRVFNIRSAMAVSSAVASLQARYAWAENASAQMGIVIHSYGIRTAKPSADYPPISEPAAFLELAHASGAIGVQCRLFAADAIGRIRDYMDRFGMYVEGMIELPKSASDLDRFETQLRASKEVGASVLRSVCGSGRRYEAMQSRQQFEEFKTDSLKSIEKALPIAERLGVQLAIENHKDWRSEEMAQWLTRLSSPHLGVCLDTGNNIALLEDPYKVVETLAPWAITTHLKDMAVAECPQGFLLAEVPFGEGMLDIASIVATIRKARPNARFNLEMITRDPLLVPCLESRYWLAMEDVPAKELAATMSMVKLHGRSDRLKTISSLAVDEQLRVEQLHVQQCVDRFSRLGG